MSKPLSNRLDKLEAEALNSAPVNHDVHILQIITNPNRTVHEVLETIIQNGVVICSNAPKEQPWPEIR